MARPPQNFYYTFEDLRKLTGLTMDAIYQHKARGDVEPASIESVVKFVARYGRLELKREILENMLLREVPNKPEKKGQLEVTRKSRSRAGRC